MDDFAGRLQSLKRDIAANDTPVAFMFDDGENTSIPSALAWVSQRQSDLANRSMTSSYFDTSSVDLDPDWDFSQPPLSMEEMDSTLKEIQSLESELRSELQKLQSTQIDDLHSVPPVVLRKIESAVPKIDPSAIERTVQAQKKKREEEKRAETAQKKVAKLLDEVRKNEPKLTELCRKGDAIYAEIETLMLSKHVELAALDPAVVFDLGSGKLTVPWKDREAAEMDVSQAVFSPANHLEDDSKWNSVMREWDSSTEMALSELITRIQTVYVS